MSEKRAVYSGYIEYYLTGKELKTRLEGRFLATGRHHSIILGIMIPDYLTMKQRVKDEKTYRVFLNGTFCMIMNAETDGKVDFFGHTDLEGIKLIQDPATITLDMVCPKCGTAMKLKSGPYSEFLGCANYPKCKHSVTIPIIGYTS